MLELLDLQKRRQFWNGNLILPEGEVLMERDEGLCG